MPEDASKAKRTHAEMIVSRFGAFLAIAAALPALTYYGMHLRDVSADIPPAAVAQKTAAPAAVHVLMPAFVKGLYVTSSTAGSSERMAYILAFADKGLINTLVVDMKDSKGALAFTPTRAALNSYTERRPALGDMRQLTASLHAKGLYLIARIATFEDPTFVAVHPEFAVKNTSGRVWADKNGITWVDAASKDAWLYDATVAREAYEAGFDEVQFDYIRFPSDGMLGNIRYDVYDGKRPKAQVIKEFFFYVDTELRVKSGIPISADLFGLTMWQHDYDLGIGQRLVDAAPNFSAISPMVYPSHYADGFDGFANPADHPYEVVRDNMIKGQALYAELRKKNPDLAAPSHLAKFRPWLQAFNLGAFYTPQMVKAQMRAVIEQGGSGWLLWNARNDYQESWLTSDAVAVK